MSEGKIKYFIIPNLSKFVKINNSNDALVDSLWIYEMNESNVIRGRREELGMLCYKVLELPMKYYSPF